MSLQRYFKPKLAYYCLMVMFRDSCQYLFNTWSYSWGFFFYSSNEITAVQYVCKHGWPQIAKLLIEYSSKVNSYDYYGHTCFIHSLILYKCLISLDADVNPYTKSFVEKKKKNTILFFNQLWKKIPDKKKTTYFEENVFKFSSESFSA